MGPHLEKKQILGQTDNQILFYLFTNGRARDDLRLRMARFVASQQVIHEFVWVPQWISTHLNVLPNALSRLGTPKYKEVFDRECARLSLTPKCVELLSEHFEFDDHLGA